MGQGVADLEPLWRAREQRAWNWYDWANSAYYTTVLAVLFAPFMITVAGRAAGCGSSADDTCSKTVDLIGIHVAAGSLPFYLTSFATISSAFLLPVVGALVDRSSRKRLHMVGFAWAGSCFAALLFSMHGTQWQLAAFAVVVSSILGGCSLVSYYAILVDISTEAERDRVSSRGWAWGYLGGGLLLAVNLVMVLAHGALGLDKELAVRLSLLSAALWWAGFTFIPFRRLRDHPAQDTWGRDRGC
jgi:MFS transporter, UMF1 family